MIRLCSVRRRCGFRGFMLTLCAVYFTAMYVFQSGLDTGHSHPGLNADGDESVQRWAHVGADVFEQPAMATGKAIERKSVKKVRLRGAVDLQAEFDNIRNVVQQQQQEAPQLGYIPQFVDDHNIPVDRQLTIRDPVPADDVNIPPTCSHTTDDLKFIVLRTDVFLYSAYWDERPNDFDNQHNGTVVRLMAVVRNPTHPRLKCHWPSVVPEIWTDIAYYEMCENHGRPYGSFILSCRVPVHVTNVPCHVTVMAEDSSTAHVPVRTLKPPPGGKSMNKFTVCVPPLFGAVSMPSLVEFLELTFILGADRIVIYEYNVPGPVRQLLNRYSTVVCGQQVVNATKPRPCRLDVIPWRLPSDLEAGMWYHGQSIAIQDCLYRHMALSHHVLFNDIDEFVIPHGEEMFNWIDVVDRLSKPDRCALQFVSAFYDPSSFSQGGDDDSSWQETPAKMKLMTMSVFKRTNDFSMIRTKCLVKPYEIFEAGIHHISKPIWANLEVHRVAGDLAYLHHYRTCLGNMGMNCWGPTINDTTMLRYQKALQRSVNKSWKLLTSNS